MFSVSHDHDIVKIYGHYALVRKDKSTFHRHLVHSFDITAYDGKSRWAAYNFVRKIYEYFAPIHLKRIRDAVALLRSPFESFMSTHIAEGESEFANSQETTSAPPSQGTENLKKPKVPPKKKWQQEIDRKDEQIIQLVALLKQQIPSDASSGQNKDTEIAMLQQELERQRQESERQREEAKQREDQLREESKQRHSELMELLKEQKEENKKLLDLLSKV